VSYLPEQPEPLAAQRERDLVVVHLQELVGRGDLDLHRFSELTGEVLAARTTAELARIVATTPCPVPLTPAHERLDEPLILEVNHGQLKMNGRWQLGRQTVAIVSHGQMILDLTSAEWDDREVELDLRVDHGQLVVTVPRAVRVRWRQLSASVVNHLDDGGVLPGAPTLQVRTEVHSGQIVFRSSKPIARSPAHRRPRGLRGWLSRRRARRAISFD